MKAIEELDATTLALDGEIAIFDRRLISRFEWLRARPKHDVSPPPIYMVFDLLELGGEDLRTRLLRERRKALEQLVADRHLIMAARRLPPYGFEAWDEVLRGNCEGMVAKDPESPTRLAARSRGSRSSSEAIVKQHEASISGDA